MLLKKMYSKTRNLIGRDKLGKGHAILSEKRGREILNFISAWRLRLKCLELEMQIKNNSSKFGLEWK